MKKAEVITNHNKFVAICDPHVYKNIRPESARKGKIVGKPESDGKAYRVKVDEEGKIHSVTLAEIRCLWTDHEANLSGFLKEAKARTAAEEKAAKARLVEQTRLIKALAQAGVEFKADARGLRLDLDQANRLVEVLFPKADRKAA